RLCLIKPRANLHPAPVVLAFHDHTMSVASADGGQVAPVLRPRLPASLHAVVDMSGESFGYVLLECASCSFSGRSCPAHGVTSGQSPHALKGQYTQRESSPLTVSSHSRSERSLGLVTESTPRRLRAPRVRLRTLLLEPAALLVLRRMHIHHIRHQRGRLTGRAGLLVLPLIGLHPATDSDERPLHHLLRGFLGLRSPHLRPLPQRVAGVFPLVRVAFELAWGVRDRERARGVPVRCESEFRVLTGAALHAHAVAHC